MRLVKKINLILLRGIWSLMWFFFIQLFLIWIDGPFCLNENGFSVWCISLQCNIWGCVCSARKLFDDMSQTDLVSWMSMILGYVCEGSVSNAFDLFRERMVKSEPNSVTLMIMLQACCADDNLIHGRQLHVYAIKSGLETDGSVQNSVLKVCTRTGSVEEVWIFFSKIDWKDDVSWNILISFYSMKGNVEKLVNRFSEMQGISTLSIETCEV